MKRTRLGVTAVVLGSAMLGSVSAAGWRDAFAPPPSAHCDLAGGFATAALLAPASAARHARLASTDGEIAAAAAGAAKAFGAARHGSLGFAADVDSLRDLNGAQTSFVRRNAAER